MRTNLRVSPRPSRALLWVAVVLAACSSLPEEKGPGIRPRESSDSVDVGYGKVARRELTGSVSVLNDDDARRTTASSFASMIDGKFPGVTVRRLANGAVSIRVRGTRGLDDMEPLYVLDGMPLQRGTGDAFAADLNPRDVKSVTVLKGTAATSMYGSRGANGAILITTRRQ